MRLARGARSLAGPPGGRLDLEHADSRDPTGRAPMTAVLVLGATGLVGGECLKLLLEEPSVDRVVAPTRRALPAAPAPPKLVSRVMSLERLDEGCAEHLNFPFFSRLR